LYRYSATPLQEIAPGNFGEWPGSIRMFPANAQAQDPNKKAIANTNSVFVLVNVLGPLFIKENQMLYSGDSA
jgi:hypothetical protein